MTGSTALETTQTEAGPPPRRGDLLAPGAAAGPGRAARAARRLPRRRQPGRQARRGHRERPGGVPAGLRRVDALAGVRAPVRRRPGHPRADRLRAAGRAHAGRPRRGAGGGGRACRRCRGSPGPPRRRSRAQDGQAAQVVVPLPGDNTAFETLPGIVERVTEAAQVDGPGHVRHRPRRAVRRLRGGLRGHRRPAAVHDRRRHPGDPAAHLPQPGVPARSSSRQGSRWSSPRRWSTSSRTPGLLTVDGQSQGILSVLVLGAGTDYALLLISRFKEELHREDSWSVAMRSAVRGAFPPIIASGRHRRARPAVPAAVGPEQQQVPRPGRRDRHRQRRPRHDALPAGAAHGPGAVLVLAVRAAPRRRRDRRQGRLGEGGRSGRATGPGRVGRRPRCCSACSPLFTTSLDTRGLATAEQFTTEVDSVVGQEVLARHFPAGTGVPVNVIGPADRADAVLEVVRATPGVASAALTSDGPPAPPGAPAPAGPPRQVDGRVQVQALLAARVGQPGGRGHRPAAALGRGRGRARTCSSAAARRSCTTSRPSRRATTG